MEFVQVSWSWLDFLSVWYPDWYPLLGSMMGPVEAEIYAQLFRDRAGQSRCFVMLLIATPAQANAHRFAGWVGGAATGPGHDFFVGDALDLVFVDRRHSFTPYHVCWQHAGQSNHRCWSGTTGQRRHLDRIFTAAPSAVGTFDVSWRIHGHVVAVWTFQNHVGD